MSGSGLGFGGGHTTFMGELQADATLNQAAPMQNTYYDILAETTGGVRIWGIGIGVATANETLEWRITIDDKVFEGRTIAATFNTDYSLYFYMSATGQASQLIAAASGTHTPYRKGILLEGHTVRVELRKITATGAGNLLGVVCYGRLGIV